MVLLTIVGRPFSGWSQTLHTPAQIIELMKGSTINYTVDSLTIIARFKTGKVISRKDLSAKLSETQALPLGSQPKGFEDLRQGDCTKAIKFLIKKSEAYKELSMENQLDFCECLHKAGEWELSLALLNALDAQFPNHYEISRKLAHALSQTGKASLAYEKITKAWLLNRNHSIIRSERLAMGTALGLSQEDWEWSPKVRVQKTTQGPLISFRPPNTWLAYGLCEAVWEYEPGYAASMINLSNRGIESIRATECLMNAMIAYVHDSNISQPIPALEALKRAVEKQLTGAFILFELKLPNKPDLAYDLSPEELANLTTYLRTCR